MLSALAIAKNGLAFVVENYKLFLLAIGAVFLFKAGVDYGESRLQKDLSSCRANSILLQSNIDSIKNQLSKSNATIENLKKISDLQQAKFNKAIKEAGTKISALKNNAASIIQESPKLADDCMATKQLISEHSN